MKHEYGIVVLKPDGNNPYIKEELRSLLKTNNMTVVEESSKRLSKQDVENHFAPNDAPLEAYIAYMTSADCHAILVHGNKVGIRLQELKKVFRERHGFNRESTANIIHTSDQGVEYFQQFPLFFPHLSLEQYCSVADMNVRLSKYDMCELTQIEKESNLSYLGIILETGQSCDLIKKYRINGGELTLFYGIRRTFIWEEIEISIIGYLPVKYDEISESTIGANAEDIGTFTQKVESLKGYLVLDYLPYEIFSEDLYRFLKSLKIRGIMTYDPRRSLKEVEVLEDIVLDEGFDNTGGSNGIVKIGKLTLGEFEFENILEHMWNPS